MRAKQLLNLLRQVDRKPRELGSRRRSRCLCAWDWYRRSIVPHSHLQVMIGGPSWSQLGSGLGFRVSVLCGDTQSCGGGAAGGRSSARSPPASVTEVLLVELPTGGSGLRCCGEPPAGGAAAANISIVLQSPKPPAAEVQSGD